MNIWNGIFIVGLFGDLVHQEIKFLVSLSRRIPWPSCRFLLRNFCQSLLLKSPEQNVHLNKNVLLLCQIFLSWSLISSEAYADKMYHLFVLRIIPLNIFCNKRNKSHWRINSWYSLWICIQRYLFHKIYCPSLYAYRVHSFYHMVHICCVYCKIHCYVSCELICLWSFCPHEMQQSVAPEKPVSFLLNCTKCPNVCEG